MPIFPRRLSTIAARCLVVLVLIASPQLWAQGCTPVPLSKDHPTKDLCYGKESWIEPGLNGGPRIQAFDFYAAPGDGARPLVIWAHPNEKTKAIPVGSDLYQALVELALDAGFSFASIEFRHPVVNADLADSATNPGVPHYDVARALQFIRANADALGIDPRNVFFVGKSRGALALWTALQDDMADPYSHDPVARQSTRVNAVFGYNMQTTYRGSEFADLFIVPGDRAEFNAIFEAENPKYLQYGSAIASVNASGLYPDPPVMLRYGGAIVPRQLTVEEMFAQDEIHYPNFGPALCQAYLRAFGNPGRCSYVADPRLEGDAKASFEGYIDFFKTYLRARPAPVLPALLQGCGDLGGSCVKPRASRPAQSGRPSRTTTRPGTH